MIRAAQLCWTTGALALALGAAGCSSIKDPRISVVDAQVSEESDAGVVVRFTIEGENTNEVELPLRFAEYTMDLDGRRVFSAERSPEATLRRLGTQRFTLPAAVRIDPGQPRPTGVHAYRVSGTLGYIAPGAFAETLFDLGVRRPTVGFSGSGQVDFGSGAPAPAPAGE